ncbi:MAG: hypothetical protein ACYDD1_06805 [Caulobacteraceae bacterium]
MTKVEKMLDGGTLEACPFCGGEAERIDIEDGENAGGSCISCKTCQASSNVEFGFKENFVSNWNRRVAAAQPAPVVAPGGEGMRDLILNCIHELDDPYEDEELDEQRISSVIKALQEVYSALLSGAGGSATPEGWSVVANDPMPKDGSVFHAWAPGYEWPEAIKWNAYDEESREETGEDGYFHFAEELLADVCDEAGPYTHWCPIPPLPEAPAASDKG